MNPFLIKLQQLSHLYDTRTPSGVSSIDLDIPANQFLSVLGPSGCGKSTLLKLIAKKLDKTAGFIEFSPNLRLTYANQVTQFHPHKSVLDSLKETYQGPELEQEDLINKIRDFLMDFEITARIHQKIQDLSAGEYQRVWLIKLLLEDPQVLVLDETFNGLDWHNRELILQILKELTQQKKLTLIWATHLLEDALRFSDRIVLLQHGVIQQSGHPEDLLQRPSNRFVAFFIGRKNLILITKSNNEYQSLFGKLTLPKTACSDRSEQVLILPPFQSDSQGDFNAKVEASYYSYGQYINTIFYKNQKFLAYSSEKLVRGSEIRFNVDTQNSFLLEEV